MQTYAACAVLSRLPNPPTEDELKPAFKRAYFEGLTERPCFRNDPRNYRSRNWWRETVHAAIRYTNRNYSKEEFDRYTDIMLENAYISEDHTLSVKINI